MATSWTDFATPVLDAPSEAPDWSSFATPVEEDDSIVGGTGNATPVPIKPFATVTEEERGLPGLWKFAKDAGATGLVANDSGLYKDDASVQGVDPQYLATPPTQTRAESLAESQYKTPEDLVKAYKNSRSWLQTQADQAQIGLAQGALGIVQQVGGGLGAVTGNKEYLDTASSASKDAQELGGVSNEMDSGQWTAKLTAGATSILPAIVGGAALGTIGSLYAGARLGAGAISLAQATKLAGQFGLAGGAGAGALQSLTQTFSDSRDAYLQQGFTEDEAQSKAWLPSVGAGLSTALATVLVPAGLNKLAPGVFGEGIESLGVNIAKQGLTKQAAKTATGFLKGISKGAAGEFPEEAVDQAMQGVIEMASFNPDKSWTDVLNESLEAGALGAALGGGIQGVQTLGGKKSAAAVPTEDAPENTIPTVSPTGTPSDATVFTDPQSAVASHVANYEQVLVDDIDADEKTIQPKIDFWKKPENQTALADVMEGYSQMTDEQKKLSPIHGLGDLSIENDAEFIQAVHDFKTKQAVEEVNQVATAKEEVAIQIEPLAPRTAAALRENAVETAATPIEVEPIDPALLIPLITPPPTDETKTETQAVKTDETKQQQQLARPETVTPTPTPNEINETKTTTKTQANPKRRLEQQKIREVVPNEPNLREASGSPEGNVKVEASNAAPAPISKPVAKIKAKGVATKPTPIPSSTKQLSNGRIIDSKENTVGWNRDVLINQGYEPTGYKLKSAAGSWEMNKAAQSLDTPIENLTAFKLPDGTWEHFLLPNKKLGEGYVSHSILSTPTPKQEAPAVAKSEKQAAKPESNAAPTATPDTRPETSPTQDATTESGEVSSEPQVEQVGSKQGVAGVGEEVGSKILAKEEAKSEVQKQRAEIDTKVAKEQKKFLLDELENALADAPKVSYPHTKTDAGRDILAVVEAESESKKRILGYSKGDSDAREILMDETLVPLYEKYKIPEKVKPMAGDANKSRPVRLAEAMRAAHSEQSPHIKIEILGDGTFDILNTKDAILDFQKRAKSFPVSTPKADSISRAPSTERSKIPTLKTGKVSIVDIIKAVQPMTSSDANRLVLMNVLSDGSEVVATDGRRIIIVKANAGGTKVKPILLREGKPLQDEGLKYPDYKQVIPDDKSLVTIFPSLDTGRLYQILTQAKAVMNVDKSKSVLIHINPDKSIGVSTEAVDIGSYEHNIQDGSTVVVALDVDFVMSAMAASRALGHENVTLRGGDSVSPVILTTEGMTQVLMPMRVAQGASTHTSNFDTVKKILSGKPAEVKPTPPTESTSPDQGLVAESSPAESFTDKFISEQPNQNPWTPEVRQAAIDYLNGDESAYNRLPEYDSKGNPHTLRKRVTEMLHQFNPEAQAKIEKKVKSRPMFSQRDRLIPSGAIVKRGVSKNIAAKAWELAKKRLGLKDGDVLFMTMAELEANPMGLSESDIAGIRKNKDNAFYYNGKSVIITDQMSVYSGMGAVESVISLILHEAVIHGGLANARQNNPKLAAEWSKLSQAIPDSELDAVVKRGYSKFSDYKTNQKSRDELAEEWLATKWEKLGLKDIPINDGTLLGKFGGWLKKLLTSVTGTKESYTDMEREVKRLAESLVMGLKERGQASVDRPKFSKSESESNIKEINELLTRYRGTTPSNETILLTTRSVRGYLQERGVVSRGDSTFKVLVHDSFSHTGAAEINERGDVVLHLGIRNIIAIESRRAGGWSYIARLVDEEIIHSAQMLGLRDQWINGGKKGNFPDFVTGLASGTLLDMHNALQSAPQETQDKVDEAASIAWNQYFVTKPQISSFDEAIQELTKKSERPFTRTAFLAEFTRQIIQADTTGDTTETGWKRLVQLSKAYWDNLIQSLKAVLPIFKSGDAGTLIRDYIQDTESQLAGFKGEEPRFSKGVQDESFTRHAELESKHDAGTITPEETAEAQRLVDEVAREKGLDTISLNFSRPASKSAFIDTMKRIGVEPDDSSEYRLHLDAPDGYVWKSTGSPTLSIHYATQSQTWWKEEYAREWPAIKEGLVRVKDKDTLDEIRHNNDDDSWGRKFDPFTGTPLAQRFDTENDDIRFSKGTGESPFYSQLSRVLDSKMGGTMPLRDLQSIIANPQNRIKADEVKWSGILPKIEELAAANNGKVPKTELLTYLKNEGAVKFEEVALTDMKGFRTQENSEESDYAGHNIVDVIDPKNGMVRFSGTPSEARNWIDEENGAVGQTPKYAQYQLPGASNYKEVVVTMPSKTDASLEKELLALIQKRNDFSTLTSEESSRLGELSQMRRENPTLFKPAKGTEYTSSHFTDIPNYLAHMRTNERTDANGEEGLFIEEIQSDRHQAGREKGYSTPNGKASSQARYNQLTSEGVPLFEAMRQADEESQEGAIPDAPYRKEWPLMLFKRALRDAVASGKQWIGWTTGETQNDRYDLSKQVDNITYDPTNKRLVASKNGQRVVDKNDVAKESLADYIGKDAANRLIQAATLNGAGNHVLKGDSLKVGGAGMKQFYDVILLDKIGDYVKQWGAKVELVTLEQTSEADVMNGEESEIGSFPIHRITINDAMSESVSAGEQPLFSKGTGDASDDANVMESFIEGIKNPYVASMLEVQRMTQDPDEVQKIAPMREFAQATINVSEISDNDGSPKVTDENTKQVMQMIRSFIANNGYALEYNKDFRSSNPTHEGQAASATAIMEIIRYGVKLAGTANFTGKLAGSSSYKTEMRKLALFNTILDAGLANDIIVGEYLTKSTAGRVLNASANGAPNEFWRMINQHRKATQESNSNTQTPLDAAVEKAKADKADTVSEDVDNSDAAKDAKALKLIIGTPEAEKQVQDNTDKSWLDIAINLFTGKDRVNLQRFTDNLKRKVELAAHIAGLKAKAGIKFSAGNMASQDAISNMTLAEAEAEMAKVDKEILDFIKVRNKTATKKITPPTNQSEAEALIKRLSTEPKGERKIPSDLAQLFLTQIKSEPLSYEEFLNETDKLDIENDTAKALFDKAASIAERNKENERTKIDRARANKGKKSDQEAFTSKGFFRSILQTWMDSPRALHENPEWREDAIKQAFMDKGFTEERAAAAAARLEPFMAGKWAKVQNDALVEAGRLMKLKTVTLDKLKNAYRAGIFDPNPVSAILAEDAGMNSLSAKDIAELAALDVKSQLKFLGDTSRADIQAEMRSIFAKAAPDRSTLNIITQGWISSSLAGLSTLSVNAVGPVSAMATGVGVNVVDIMVDVQQGKMTTAQGIDAMMFQMESALKNMKNMPREFHNAVTKESFKEVGAQIDITRMHSLVETQRREAEKIKRLLKLPKSLTNYAKTALAMYRFTLSTTDVIRRILSSLDQMHATFTHDQMMSSGVYKALVGELKMSSKEARQLISDLTDQADQTMSDYEAEFPKATPSMKERHIREKTQEYLTEYLNQKKSGLGSDIRETAKAEAIGGTGNYGKEDHFQWDVVQAVFEMSKRMAQAARNNNNELLGRIMTGFVTVPANIFNRSAYWTPYGLLRVAAKNSAMKNNKLKGEYNALMKTRQQMRLRTIEGFAGTIGMVLMIALAAGWKDDDEPVIQYSGDGPEDTGIRDALMKLGWKPRSLLVFHNGRYKVALKFAEGKNISTAILGSLSDMRQDKKLKDGWTAQRFGELISLTLMNLVKQSASMKYNNPISEAMTAQSTSKSVMAKFLYSASSLVPFNAALRSITKIATGPIDAKSSLEAAIWANTPIAGGFFSYPEINALGDQTRLNADSPIFKYADRVFEAGLPVFFGGTTARNEEIYRFINETGNRPSMPDRKPLERRNLRVLTNKEWYDYIKLRGSMISEDMTDQMDKLRDMESKDAEKAVATISARATERAKSDLNLK